MNRPFTAFILLILATTYMSYAQPRIQWARTYGGRGDPLNDIFLTNDGNFALCGSDHEVGARDNAWLLLVDGESLEPIFNNTYGDVGAFHVLYSLVETDDGGFFSGGYDSRARGGNFMGLRVDADGEEIWRETYGGERRDACKAVIELKSGNFLMAGYTRSFGDGGSDGYLVEIDGEGELIWSDNYDVQGTSDALQSLREADDGYLAAGRSNREGWLIKTDEEGELIWSNLYRSEGFEDNYLESFNTITSCDGGYLLAGMSEARNLNGNRIGRIWAVKVDPDGEIIWQNIYDIGEPGTPKTANCTIEDVDGGFVLVGELETGEEMHQQGGSIALKISEVGDYQWHYYFPYGGDIIGAERLNSAVIAPDGGIVTAGEGHDGNIERGGLLLKVVPAVSAPVILEKSPEYTEFDVLVGDTVDFNVYAVDLQDDELTYLWSMNGDSIASDTFATVVFEETGDFNIKCLVSDGALADSALWLVHSREFYIEGYDPDSLEIVVQRGRSQDFTLDMAALENIELEYEWTLVDRNLRRSRVGDSDSVSVRFNLTGDHLLNAQVSHENRRDEITWSVEVRSIVWYWWPHDLVFRIEVDSTQLFEIFPFYEESDSLECLWTIDGEELDFGNDIDILFNEVGVHEVVAYVTEGVEADTVRWEVEVYDAERTADFADCADLPTEATLYAPSPNPFNAVVNLKFYLPYAQDVSLRVYDVHGREMLECCGDVMLEGAYLFSWDGSEAAAGLYFAVLDVGGERRIRKMVLAK